MSPLIERIEAAGPDKRARLLVFPGEEQKRLTSAAAVKALGLDAGVDLELTELDALEPAIAQDRALRYLGYRDRSVQEVLTRLLSDGYPERVAGRVVERLTELELLDDRRFARIWAEARTRSGVGPGKILRELVLRGLDPDIAQRIIDDSSGDPLATARAVLRGRTAATYQEKTRLVRKLISRGFAPATAWAAVSPPDDQAMEDDSAPFVSE